MVMYIPVDIVSSILRRVPAESLLRFKLVCKQWQSMINTDPLFPKVDMLVIRTECFDDQIPQLELNNYLIPLGSLSSSSKTTIYDIKTNALAETYVPTKYSSCHGFLLHNFLNGVWAWNPFSDEHLDLPQVFEASDRLGLGYCVKTNDYKVVRIYKDYNLNRKRTSIYSVKSRAWHHIEDFPCHFAYGGVFANGSLHFLSDEGIRSDDVMISLDLSNEAYSKLPLPNCTVGIRVNRLHSLDGRLFLTHKSSHDDLWELWILQDFGKENGKWNKLIPLSGTPNMMSPIAYLKSKEQIVVSCDQRFVWFDLKSNKCIKEVTVKAGNLVAKHVSVELTGSVSLDWFNGNSGDDLKYDTAKNPTCFMKLNRSRIS